MSIIGDIDAAARFAAVSADRSIVHVPAHARDGQPRLACVHLKREPGKLVCRCESFYPLGNGEAEPCESRNGKTLCYHVRAAIIAAGLAGRCRVYFFRDDLEAKRKADGGTFFHAVTPEGIRCPCVAYPMVKVKQATVKPITVEVPDTSVPEWGKGSDGTLVF